MNVAMLLEMFRVMECEVRDFRENNIGLFGVDKDRVSWLLLVQLTSALKYRSFNTFSVTDVIRHLERLRPTRLVKKPEQFKHPPLNRFWKTHFTDPRFLRRNIYNEWGMFGKESKKFERLCEQAMEEETVAPSPVGWQGRLAHAFTAEGYQARATRQEMTGEWIIFGKYKGQKYYLCIAQHSKTRETDEEIYEATKRFCDAQFPFLFGNTAIRT